MLDYDEILGRLESEVWEGRYDPASDKDYYSIAAIRKAARDTINAFDELQEELRKATEPPRVLTWDELWDEGHPQTVWVEDPYYTNSFIEAHYDAKGGFPEENLPIYITDNREYWFEKSDEAHEVYGRRVSGYYFRAWSKEPTERQRKAVEWDG